MFKRFIVAIDGPAGSGKSTSAKLVAQKLNFLYIDTGAMYRAITFLAMKNKILTDHEKVTKIADSCTMKLEFVSGDTKIQVDGVDLTNEIRSPEVNSHVSDISKITGVREALVKKQREMASENVGVVMEGRDIGTVVFPDAEVHIFLTAPLAVRAQRWQKDQQERGHIVPFEKALEAIAERDVRDSSRACAPLRVPEHAVIVDAGARTPQQVLDELLGLVKKIRQILLR